MPPDVGLLHAPAPARRPGRLMAPMLIQVPALRGSARRPAGGPPRRRRRRLRRGVRLGGAALLLGVPAAWLAMTVAGSWTAAPEPASAPGGAPPVVLLAPVLESATGADGADVPVVRPSGYLLPDDVSEDPDHAGS